MRTTMLALGLAAALGTVPAEAAIGTPGPFAGAVKQGETRVHVYGNNPTGGECIDLAVPYRVALSTAPTGNVLRLSAGGHTVYTTGGGAAVTFWSGVCTSFGVEVHGYSVTAVAPYTVTVTRDLGLS
jgi:hypothetical protein